MNKTGRSCNGNSLLQNIPICDVIQVRVPWNMKHFSCECRSVQHSHTELHNNVSSVWMSVYVTGIGAMRQPTVQSAVASFQIRCNLYGSHTVVFAIKWKYIWCTISRQNDSNIKGAERHVHHQTFIFKISQKWNLTSTFLFRAKHKIFTNGIQFLLSQKPHTL
jgi:hypothetical protein